MMDGCFSRSVRSETITSQQVLEEIEATTINSVDFQTDENGFHSHEAQDEIRTENYESVSNFTQTHTLTNDVNDRNGPRMVNIEVDAEIETQRDHTEQEIQPAHEAERDNPIPNLPAESAITEPKHLTEIFAETLPWPSLLPKPQPKRKRQEETDYVLTSEGALLKKRAKIAEKEAIMKQKMERLMMRQQSKLLKASKPKKQYKKMKQVDEQDLAPGASFLPTPPPNNFSQSNHRRIIANTISQSNTIAFERKPTEFVSWRIPHINENTISRSDTTSIHIQ